VLLGCLQPGQASSTFSDALNRLADRLHYLNSSGDKAQEVTRFWFDTRANLRREMEDRKGRFNDQNEVRGKIGDVLRKLIGGASIFGGSHIFTPHADVPDDGALRLVVFSPEKFYSKQEMRIASEEVIDFVRNNGQKPRYRSNRLIFIAPDHASLTRMRDCVRTALAWNSIVDDVKGGRLNIDGLQEQQARKELQSAEDVLPRVARECYKWLLCPVQAAPTDRQPSIEAFPLNTSGSALGAEIQRVCHDNELVISAWSPIHLRDTLKKFYWKDGKVAVSAMAFWEDMQRYLYLPRLESRYVLEHAVMKGAITKDFFGTAYGQTGDVFEGFRLGDANVQFDDTLLLIEPEAAEKYKSNLPVDLKLGPGFSDGASLPPAGPHGPSGLQAVAHCGNACLQPSHIICPSVGRGEEKSG
jgi:predicted AAA+ superfamily ATPase